MQQPSGSLGSTSQPSGQATHFASTPPGSAVGNSHEELVAQHSKGAVPGIIVGGHA
jgi:hypothetical protein